MALKNDIYFGVSGAEVLLSPFGRKFTPGYMEFARSERTASARGVKDIYATKRKFNLDYSIIDNALLEIMKAYYELEAALSLIVTNQDSTTTTYTVLFAPFDWTRLLAAGNGLWEGVSFQLEEV